MKTLNFYLEPKLELLPAFTELSKSAKAGMILFPLPDFAVQETPLGIFTLIPIDLTPISKSTDLKGGILQEIYQTKFGHVHFKNLVPCFIQKSPKAGSIIEGGMIVGEVIKSVYPVQSMDGKLVPIHKSQAIVIANDLDNLFTMKLTADENRQELLDLMDEFSPKIDIMKSIFGSTATKAGKATNTNVQQTPPQGEQKSNPGNPDENNNSAGHSTPPTKSNAEGAERPGHKYLSRKRNPRYPSGSNSKYIYLYKLANGTAQWQDGSGQPVTESSTVPSEKTSVVQKIVDLFKQKSGNQEQKSPAQPPKEDSQPQPKPEKPVNPIGINSQFTVKGDKNRLYRAVTNISDKGYLVEDDRGDLSIMSHEQVKQKAETHHNFQNGNTISINGKDHNIVKVVKNLILAKDPENGKLSFHGTFGTNPVSVDDEAKSKQIWEARNESIRQQKEQMAETERKWAQNKVEIAHVAEKHGFKSDPGMPIFKKSVQVFGSDADIQLYHDGKSVRSTINGSKVKWNIGGESLEVFDFNPDKMEITASHEDGTKTTHSFNEVKRFQPGYLHFGNDGGLSVSYTGEEGQQHDRINLEHLGQFSPIDLVNNQKAAYIIKSGVYAAVQSGDRIQFQKVGTLANGVVIAKGNHVAGVIDESTGRPALVNQSNIQNIVPHDENSTELQDVAKSFQENATGNMHGESVPRQEIITKYQATLEGHKQNVEQIKSDIAKTSDPFERDRLVTSLAHAELQFGQAKEAVLRAQTHIGSRIPKNIVGYHEAKRQKEDLQMIVDGHEKYIQAKRARLQVLSIAHQTALSDPSQHEQAGKMFKEMFDIHTDINRAQKEKTKVEKQLSVANDTMTKVSQSNGGFVPSSLHELSVPEGNRQDVFTKLSNPRNDLKGSDGSVLPQYTTTGKLADTIIHHLDAAGTAKPYEKPAIWNRINEFLSGARVITTPGVSHEIEGVNRPFTPEEIEQFPALEHLGQMEQDHDYGTELISAMARELHSHPDLAGQGHTEHDAIEGLYGIKLNKTTPEHHQFSGSVLPNEESKPVSVRQSPVPSAAKNQNEHTKVGTATHIDAIKEHLSQPENAEKLGDLDEFGALSHELGQKITDDQLKQNEISSHFQDDSGIGLPTHQTEGQDGNTLINSRQIIEDQAIATHEADRVKGDTNPVIATRIPEEGSEPTTMELLNHERKFGPEGLVNPFSLRVHKVFPQKLEKEIRENLHNMPAGTTVESVMSKLNFALHGDEFESYQGRDETDVNRAMNYALKWDSEIQEGDPVFFHSPTGSDFHAFSGNHRTLGAQLYGAIHGKIPSFYAKQFLGKREDAVQKGEDNNLQGETETPKEFAYKIKKWASEYGSDFPEKIRERLGKSKETVPLIKKLHRLSHLDRDGSFWQYMDDPAYKEMKIDRFADFSAGLRKTYPQLTDRHEQEVFDHLFNNRDELMNLLSKQKIPGIGGEKVASHRAIMDKIDTAVQLKISDPSFKPDDRLNLNVLNSVKKQSSAPANWRNLDDQERDRYNELSPMFEGPKGKDQIELTIKNYIEARTKAYKDSGRQVTGSDNAKFLDEAKDHIQALREEHSSLNEKLHFVDENQEDMFGGMFKSSWIQILSDHYDWIEKSGNQIGMFDNQSELSFPDQPKSTPGQTKTNQAGHQETLKPGKSGKNRWQTDEKQPIQKPVADLSSLFFKPAETTTKTRSPQEPVFKRMTKESVQVGTIRLSNKRIESTSDFVDIMGKLADSGQEHFITLGLDKNKKPLSMFAGFIGSMNATVAHPMDVITYLEKNPGIKHVIMCHNHPSGNSKPSNEDIELTRKQSEILGVYNRGTKNKVGLLDHIVVAKTPSGYTGTSIRSAYGEYFEKSKTGFSENGNNEAGEESDIPVMSSRLNRGKSFDDTNYDDYIRDPHSAKNLAMKYIPAARNQDTYLISMHTDNSISAIHPFDINGKNPELFNLLAQAGTYNSIAIHFGNPNNRTLLRELETKLAKQREDLSLDTKKYAAQVLDFIVINPDNPSEFSSLTSEGYDLNKSLMAQIASVFGLTPILKSWYKIQQKTFAGLPISIENAKGTDREGTDKDGHHWKVKMYHDYGYIRRTEGTDGDQIDVYLGPDEDYDFAYIVHQNDPVTGKFDEDKVMLGFSSAEEARKAYKKQYDRPGFFGSMEMIERERFEKMVRSKIYKGKPLTVLQETI